MPLLSSCGAISPPSTLTRSSITDRARYLRPLVFLAHLRLSRLPRRREIASGGMGRRSSFSPPAPISSSAHRRVRFLESFPRTRYRRNFRLVGSRVQGVPVDKHICLLVCLEFTPRVPSRPFPPRLSSFAFVQGRSTSRQLGSVRVGECENLVASIFEAPRLGNPTFLHGRLCLFPVDPYFGTFEREENSARARARLSFSRGRICVTRATCGRCLAKAEGKSVASWIEMIEARLPLYGVCWKKTRPEEDDRRHK